MQRHQQVSQSPAEVGSHEGCQRKLKSDKWKTGENVGPLLNETGDLVTQDMNMLPLLARTAFRNRRPQRSKVRSKEVIPSMEEDQIRE